jgi:DNA-binding winged helix-turn-helix (wHTH) protein
MLTLRSTAYEFGPYRLDPLGRSLLRRGEVIALPPKAVEVLVQLVRHPGNVVGKQELIESVWPETIVEEANLNQMIFLLRRAFGSDGGNGNGAGEYIATIPRRGYRFTAGVRTVEIPCRIESIAVLPLANPGGDPTQEYFADGITESLITELAKIRSLRVVSRTSVMRYRDTKESVSQIARALRVQAVLRNWFTRPRVSTCGPRRTRAQSPTFSLYKLKSPATSPPVCVRNSAKTREPGSQLHAPFIPKRIRCISKAAITRGS